MSTDGPWCHHFYGSCTSVKFKKENSLYIPLMRHQCDQMIMYLWSTVMLALPKQTACFEKITRRRFLSKSTDKSYWPPVLSYPFPFLWFSMVRVDSGPCDGGTTLCFFCTAMLARYWAWHTNALTQKSPSSLSLSLSSSSFEFLFQDAFGSSLSKCVALCISCLSICALPTKHENKASTYAPLSTGPQTN